MFDNHRIHEKLNITAIVIEKPLHCFIIFEKTRAVTCLLHYLDVKVSGIVQPSSVEIATKL